MIKKYSHRVVSLVAMCIGLCHITAAQTDDGVSKFGELDLAVGNTEGSLSMSFSFDKGVGKNKKLVLGIGGRITSYLGKNQYYATAPAKLTSGSRGPLVLFKENINANMDTFLVKSAQVNAVNLIITLGYNFSEKLMIRFNIDAIGFTVGKKTNGNYINGFQGAMESAQPTVFNLLLISDNDRGSLNSQLFVRYLLNGTWGVKAGFQFLFTEYTTDSEVQQLPEPNDRFRNKSFMFCAGVSRKF